MSPGSSRLSCCSPMRPAIVRSTPGSSISSTRTTSRSVRFTRGPGAVSSRPTVDEVYRYRRHVDDAVLALMHFDPGRALGRGRFPRDARPSSRAAAPGAASHGHQAQLRGQSAARPRTSGASSEAMLRSRPLRWIERAGGHREIGHEGSGFAFDNETPRHAVLLRDHALASRPVTNGEYLEVHGLRRLWRCRVTGSRTAGRRCARRLGRHRSTGSNATVSGGT